MYVHTNLRMELPPRARYRRGHAQEDTTYHTMLRRRTRRHRHTHQTKPSTSPSSRVLSSSYKELLMPRGSPSISIVRSLLDRHLGWNRCFFDLCSFFLPSVLPSFVARSALLQLWLSFLYLLLLVWSTRRRLRLFCSRLSVLGLIRIYYPRPLHTLYKTLHSSPASFPSFFIYSEYYTISTSLCAPAVFGLQVFFYKNDYNTRQASKRPLQDLAPLAHLPSLYFISCTTTFTTNFEPTASRQLLLATATAPFLRDEPNLNRPRFCSARCSTLERPSR